MPVSSSDIVVYGSQNMAEADNAIQGGAIDTAKRVVFTDLAANDTVKIVSTAGDTGTVTITGRGATGAIVSEVLTLNGTSSVAGSTTFQRILKNKRKNSIFNRIVRRIKIFWLLALFLEKSIRK